jgi:hypothetical protein
MEQVGGIILLSSTKSRNKLVTPICWHIFPLLLFLSFFFMPIADKTPNYKRKNDRKHKKY